MATLVIDELNNPLVIWHCGHPHLQRRIFLCEAGCERRWHSQAQENTVLRQWICAIRKKKEHNLIQRFFSAGLFLLVSETALQVRLHANASTEVSVSPDNSATSKIPTITSTENGLLDVWFAVVRVWQLVLWRLVK